MLSIDIICLSSNSFIIIKYNIIIKLTHFMPLISFNTPWKHMFSGGIKWDQWDEMG